VTRRCQRPPINSKFVKSLKDFSKEGEEIKKDGSPGVTHHPSSAQGIPGRWEGSRSFSLKI